MSTVAQRKDISDPEIISTFAMEMGTQLHLDHLYLLTICDIRGTNPKHWNSWKDNLLAELYHKTSTALRMGLDNPANRDFAVKETQTSTLRLLSHQGYDPEKINELWRHFTAEYFLHHSQYEGKWHTSLILDAGTKNLPLIKARLTQRGRTELFIYTHEQDDLFATIVSTLDQLGLTIVDALVMATDNGFTLDTFKVLEEDGNSPDSEFRIDEIVSRLKERLSRKNDTISSGRPASRAQKHFQVETKIRFEQLPGKDITLMNIVTTDRPGLLARIGKAFIECGIRVHNAKISTAGEKVNDAFQITDTKNQPLLDEENSQQLRASIIKHLNE